MTSEERERFRQSVREHCGQTVREPFGVGSSDPKPEEH